MSESNKESQEADQHAPKHIRGFSLVELLTVITLVIIVTVIAVPNLTSANDSLERQNGAKYLKFYLERARFDAIKRNAFGTAEMPKVIINNATSFTFASDKNYDGRIDSAERTDISFKAGSGVRIVGEKLIFPVTIVFNNRGQAQATDGTNAKIAPAFTVCERNCKASEATNANSETVYVSPTGTAAIVDSGGVFLDPTVPDVTAVGIDTGVNPGAQIK